MTYIGKQLKRYRKLSLLHFFVAIGWVCFTLMAPLSKEYFGLALMWWNTYGFWLIYKDKRLAIEGSKFRIPEVWFWWIALSLGGLGVWLAMKRIRHKTQHRLLYFGISGITILGYLMIAIVLWWWLKGGKI
jgi:uncharacterized membrane protein YsdA (DUF1294 family)